MTNPFYKLYLQSEIDSLTSSWITDSSNAIEGIYVDWIGTRVEGEVSPPQPLHDDHVTALEYVMAHSSHSPKTADLLELHRMLLHRADPKIAGKVRTTENFMHAGGEFLLGNPLPEYVSPLLDDLSSRWNRAKSLDTILRNHYELMTIHPFDDGNGRTGRLFLNWQTLRALGVMISILPHEKQQYYKAIQSFRADFVKRHPEVKYTTYDSLSENTKKYLTTLKKRISERSVQLYNSQD